MAPNVQIDVYMPAELVEAVDEQADNRSRYIRELIEADLEVSADA